MSVANRPRWRRLEPDARREQILDCAVHLFGERPYAGVSTSDIAREAGVARGLLNHYFGTKRDLYLEVVRRMVVLPEMDNTPVAAGTMAQRVDCSVDWFLDAIGATGKTFVAVTGAEGIGDDPEIEQILAHADDIAARKVLQTVGLGEGLGEDEQSRAMIRAYGGMVKAAVREWIRNETLERDEVRLLLSHTLVTIVRDVLPDMCHPSRPERSAVASAPR